MTIKIDPGEMRLASRWLDHLDHDLDHYNVWLRTLVCVLVDGPSATPDELNLLTRTCYDFGPWLLGEDCAALRNLPAYARLVSSHDTMHRMAGVFIACHARNERIPGDEFSIFIDQTNVFRSCVHALQAEIREIICSTDPLTGACSRREMMRRLNDEYQRMIRCGHRSAIAMADIDHFKSINDLYGHGAGDRVLVWAVGMMMDSMREYDALYRYGGEEFLLCLPYMDAVQAGGMVDRLRCRIGSAVVPGIAPDELKVTVSFGIAEIDTSTPLETCIARADSALYRAKQSGRNRVERWAG